MLTGVDISHWQNVSFDALRGNADFVISKLTEGTISVDPTGVSHVSETRRIGAIPGVYHFARNGDPNLEAGYFLAHAPSLLGAFIALDAETGQSVSWCLTWLTAVKRHVGASPVLYLNKSTIADLDWSPVVNAGFVLWEADYDGNAADFSETTEWPRLTFKQYTETGTIPGIPGNVDRDSFNGTRAQLQSMCVGYKPASPGITYRVALGDTLSLLAQRTWGNASLWPRIYNANKNVIGPNPNVLHPGIILHII